MVSGVLIVCFLYLARASDCASVSSFGFFPWWSNGPVRRMKSVLKASVLTQWACSLRVRTSLPCMNVMKSVDMVDNAMYFCRRLTHILGVPDFDCTVAATSVDQTFASPSNDVHAGIVSCQGELCEGLGRRPDLDGSVFRRGSTSRRGSIAGRMDYVDQSRRSLPWRSNSTYRWMGSHAKLVIHLVWPFLASPIAFPVRGSQNLTCPSCPPVATTRSLPSHSVQRTHPLCPTRVCFGSSISMSHRRAVESPDPVTAYRPVGDKDPHRIGCACPVQ